MTTPIPAATSRVSIYSVSSALLMTLLVAWVARPARAADVTWDASPGTMGVQAGGGFWSTSIANWTIDSGSTNIPWTNGPNIAVFTAGESGTSASITLSEAITAGGLRFDVAGYIIDDGANALTLDLGDNTTPSVIANASATINAVLAGNDGLTKLGDGTLTLGGSQANSYTGLTTVAAGTLRLDKDAGVTAVAGDLEINSTGALTLAGANQLAATSHLQVNGGTITALATAQTLASYTQTAGGLTASGNIGDVTITGTMTLLGGNTVTLNSGSVGNTASWTVNQVVLEGAGILMGGNSGAAADRTSFTIGSGGLTLTNQSIIMYRGNAGTLLNLFGDVTTSGAASIAVQNSGAVEPLIDLGTGVRTINVTGGSMDIGVTISNTAVDLVKQGDGHLSLLQVSGYTGDTLVQGGTLQVTDVNGRLTNTTGILVSGGIFQNGSSVAATNNGITGRINTAASVMLGGSGGGGTFTHAAAAAGQSHLQTLAGLTVAQGFNFIDTTGATGTNALSFTGAYTRLAGGWLDVRLQAGFTVSLDANPLANGSTVSGTAGSAILSGASLNQTDFIKAQAGAMEAATYENTGTDTWTTGANMNVTGTNPLPYAATTINSLRFDEAASHTVTLTGAHTITSGMILVTASVGANNPALTGGTLEPGAGEALTIFQHNKAGVFTIASDIVNSTGGLTKAGAGTLVISGNNTYTGATRVLEGILRTTGGGLSLASNLELNSGVLETSGTFVRSLGSGPGEVQLTGSTAGFSAFGGSLTVNLGGAAAQVAWGSPFFAPDVLLLNAASADGALDFQNGIDLGPATRTIQADSLTQVATISGIITGSPPASGLVKTGTGILELTAANTYLGDTTLNGGTLLAGNDSAFATGTVLLRAGTLGASGGDRVLANNFRLAPTATVFAAGSNGIRITGSFTAVGNGTSDITNTLSSGIVLELAGNVYLAETNVSNIFRIFGGGTTLVSGNIANNAAENTAAGHIHFNSSGLLRLTGTNTFTGSILAAGSGAIAVRADANFGAAPPSPYTDSIILAAGGRLLIEESFTLNSNRQIGIGNSGGGSNTGTIEVATGRTFVVGGVIADRTRNQDESSTTPANTGSLRKTGNGAMELHGNNTYSGLTSVSNGVLRLGANGALGTSATGTTVSSGAQVELLNGVVISGETITIGGSGMSNAGLIPPGSPDTNRGALQAATGATGEWAGSILLNSASSNRIGTQANGTLILSGVIDDGAENYILELGADTDNGTIILSGANTYGDGITALTRTVRGTTKLGAHDTLPTWTSLDLHFASSNNSEVATLDMNGFNQAVKELFNTGNSNASAVLTNATQTLSTLTINQDTVTNYGGIITGNVSLIKNGAGSLTLTRFNTYNGDTVINEGVLQALGGNAIADSGGKGNVILNGGAGAAGTLDIRTSESINGLDGTAGAVLGRVVNDSTTAGQVTLRVGGGQADGSFAGLILDNNGGTALGTIALAKIGTGTQTLSGANAFTGPIVAYSGTLVLDYASNDPLNGNVIRLGGGTVHFKGAATGTTDSFSTLSIHASTFSQVIVDQSAGGTSAWETSGIGTTSGGGGAQGLLLLDRTSGANLKSTASFSGIFMTGGRAIAYVRDADGTGYMTRNAQGELVRYAAYTDAGTAGDQILGNHAGDGAQAYANSSNLKMTGAVARTADLNFATLLVEALAGDILLDLGSSDLLASASNGRGILVTGTDDFTITGTADSSLNNSVYLTTFSTGKTTIDIAMGAGVALVTGGTGFVEYTKSVTADLYATGNLLRLTGDQNYQSTGVLRLSSGGVLEIGADLDTSIADADFTRILGTATRLYGDAGFSAYTPSAGGVRVVRLGISAAGDGGTITWGSNFFLVTQESSPADIDAVFKLSSAESNATLEFQNPINLNSRVRTIDVANGTAEVDARLTGVLSSPSGGVVKRGLGTLEVTAANTYAGGTEILEGTFLASNTTGSATGSGNVRIAAGARVGGTGVVGDSTKSQHLLAEGGSILMVGNTHGVTGVAGGQASALTLATSGTGVITLSGTVQLDLFANNDGVNPTANNDVLALTSAESIELGGTLVVNNSTGTDSLNWMLDTTWQLIDWSNVSAGTKVSGAFDLVSLPALDPAITWDLSQLYTQGTITIAAIPEPSRLILLSAAMGATLLRRRRRRI